MKKKNDSIRRAADKKKEARNKVKAKAYQKNDSAKRGGKPSKKGGKGQGDEAIGEYDAPRRSPLTDGEKA